ncbi:immunoglobulin-like domain-containing protein [Peribacillus butanolivorans]|uniref:immunoglobulin-like domain-containing protein n=1 Tax=Peribacillus butanolivorans TaxID=421767 RepID=UPI0036DF3184
MKRILYSLVSLVVLIIVLAPTSGMAATDTTKPTISGVSNTTVYLNQTFNPKKGVTAKDNVDGNITSLIGISGKVDTKKIGNYTLTYKVTDTAKNTTTVKRVVTVKKDTTNPTITGATNKTAYLGYSFDAKSGVKATDNADGNITSKIKITGQVNTKNEGTYKLKYSVTDNGRNTRTVTRVITIKKDKEKPKITGATNKTVYKGYSFDPKTSVTATDNVDGNITSKITISGKVNDNDVGIYKLQYTAIDKTGNKTTVTRTITVKKDTTKPQITGAEDKTINYGASFDPKSGVKATDNIDGTITSKMTITGSVNVRKVGTYKLVYSAKDKTDNKITVTRTINVVDKVKPTLTGTGLKDTSFAIGIYDSFHPLFGITAYDNADGNLTSEIKVEGTVNVDKAGQYTLIYSVTDKSGNKTTAERKVTVIDNIPPKISGVDNIYVQYFDPFEPMEGVTSSDNNDGDLTSKVVVKAIGEKLNTSDLSLSGTFTYEYSVSDEAGNTTTAKRQVTLTYRDAEFFGTGDIKINLGETFDPLEGVTATDMGNGEDATSLIEVSGDVDVNSLGTYTLTYRILDKGFRTGTQRKVTVVDNIPPVITGVQDLTVDQNNLLPDLLQEVKAMDNIDGDLTRKIYVDTQNVDTSTEGEYIVTYSVTDKMGNKTEVQSTITVKKVPVTKVEVNSDTSNIVKPGETFELWANAYPNNASFPEATSWESSDETVATVDEKGTVKTLADGTVTFTATVDGVKGSVTITVSGRPELRFFTGGWEADPSTRYLRIDKMDFDAINDGEVPVTIDSVKVYDPDGSSPEDLVELDFVTNLAPSSRTNVSIDFEDGKGPLINGGRLSIFATIPNGTTYEYSIKFRY